MFSDTQPAKYAEERCKVIFQGKPITVTDRTPMLSPEQRERRKKEIEHTLYHIFKKYAEIPKQSA